MKTRFSGKVLAIAALVCAVILIGSCVPVPAPGAPAVTVTPAPAVETAIQLPDGTQCLFAGRGATLAFDGKRLNYTCGKTAAGEEIGLLGDPEGKGFTWTVEKVVIGHNDKGFFVKESQKIVMEISRVELADGTQCLNAGKGATLAFAGKRLNYTCKVAGADQVGLIGGFIQKDYVWSVERATIVRKEGTFALGESAIVPIEAVIGSAAASMAGDSNELTGTSWVWQGLLMNNDTTKTPSDPTLYTLAFLLDGRVSIKADCNMAGGAYKVEGKKISFGPLATTLAACAPGSLYDEYLKRLGEVESYLLQDGKLILLLKMDSGSLKFAPQPPAASVTGSVSYRQRIALAPDAVIQVSLLDVSKQDAAATVIVSQTIPAAGKQVPFPFELKFDPTKIDPKGAYAVQARIMVDGKLAWTSTQSYRVLTQGNPTKIEVLVEQVGQ